MTSVFQNNVASLKEQKLSNYRERWTLFSLDKIIKKNDSKRWLIFQMVARSVIKIWYAKRLQPNKKPALICFLVLLIVLLLGQTVAFSHYINSFICCGAPVLKPQTPEKTLYDTSQQRQREALVSGGDRDAWMEEECGVTSPSSLFCSNLILTATKL